MELRNPWTWPIIVMVVLIVIVLVGTMLAIFAGCAASRDTPTPVQDQTGYEIHESDLSTFSTTLPSGRRVECVAVTYHGSALQCWPVTE